jgi:hypothetical protein
MVPFMVHLHLIASHRIGNTNSIQYSSKVTVVYMLQEKAFPGGFHVPFKCIHSFPFSYIMFKLEEPM